MLYNVMEYMHGGGKMKKKLIAVLIIIAIFIPTYLAVAYYVSAQNAPVAERTVEKLTLTDLEKKDFVFNKQSTEGKDMISFFVEMNDASKEVPELPDQLKSIDCYKAVYRCYNKDKVYRYYFTDNPNEAYYVDAQHKTYSIPADKAVEFLSTKFAESTYPASAEPRLTVSKMSILEPYNMDWKYKAGAGDYISTSYTGTPDASSQYPVSGSLQLEFTNQPDYVTVIIKQGEQEIFNDIYENLTPAIIGETNKTFNIEVNAKWYESEEKESYGEAKYLFTANVSAPASFYLGEATIEQGEFVVLTGKNILDINNIGFKSEPSINYTPVFYKEGDFVVALIPISAVLEYSPSYVFTVSSGGVTEELTLTVMERAKKSNIYSAAPADLVNRTRTPAIIESYNNALRSTINNNETTRYWNDVFTEPVANRQIRWGFGRNIIISSTATQFMNQGVDYVVNGSDQAIASNGGKVAYIGEQLYSGKLVVIDHGYGLKSWYMNLSSIAVNVGDIVEKGAVVGTVGDSGFTNGGVNLHYELTVHGVPVCPYSLNEEGIKMYIGG